MKTCSRCNQQKEEREFQIRRASKDGLSSACKSCLSDYDRSRANLPQRVKARAEYQKSDRGESQRQCGKSQVLIEESMEKKSPHYRGQFFA